MIWADGVGAQSPYAPDSGFGDLDGYADDARRWISAKGRTALKAFRAATGDVKLSAADVRGLADTSKLTEARLLKAVKRAKAVARQDPKRRKAARTLARQAGAILRRNEAAFSALLGGVRATKAPESVRSGRVKVSAKLKAEQKARAARARAAGRNARFIPDTQGLGALPLIPLAVIAGVTVIGANVGADIMESSAATTRVEKGLKALTAGGKAPTPKQIAAVMKGSAAVAAARAGGFPWGKVLAGVGTAAGVGYGVWYYRRRAR